MAGNDSELINEMVTKKPFFTSGKIIWPIVIIVACGGAYFTYQSMTKKESTYLSMAVSKGVILDQVQGTGTIKPLHEVDLYFKQQGTLKELNARSGDAVKEGQVLAVQDNADLQAQLEQARNDLLLAQYKQQQSELDLEKVRDAAQRQDSLYQAGAVAKSDWEQTNRDYATAKINNQSDQASVATSKAKVVIAETNLKNAQLTAPFSGVAAQVNGEVGQETGNSSSPMFHLISNELQVLAMVNEVDIGRVKLNQEVLFTVSSYPNQPFKGTVSRISPQATTTNNIQLYEVDIATNDLTHQLRAGMSVTANIIINQRSEVTIVPNIAFAYTQTYLMAQRTASNQSANTASNKASNQNSSPSGSENSSQNGAQSGRRRTNAAGVGQQSTGGQSWGSGQSRANGERRVVVLQDDKPVVKTIKVGLSDSSNTEVISGLTPGDKVVIGANDSSKNSSSGTSTTQQRSSGQQRMPMGGGFSGGGRPN